MNSASNEMRRTLLSGQGEKASRRNDEDVVSWISLLKRRNKLLRRNRRRYRFREFGRIGGSGGLQVEFRWRGTDYQLGEERSSLSSMQLFLIIARSKNI